MKDGCVEKAVHKFLSTGAPMPEGMTQVARYHAPGSGNGWLVVETDDPTKLYIHATEWGELLTWKTTPVLEDKEAGVGCASVWKKD